MKQLCKRKVRDFAMALRARKFSGTFEKRDTAAAPAPAKKMHQCIQDLTEQKTFLDYSLAHECVLYHVTRIF